MWHVLPSRVVLRPTLGKGLVFVELGGDNLGIVQVHFSKHPLSCVDVLTKDDVVAFVELRDELANVLGNPIGVTEHLGILHGLQGHKGVRNHRRHVAHCIMVAGCNVTCWDEVGVSECTSACSDVLSSDVLALFLLFVVIISRIVSTLCLSSSVVLVWRGVHFNLFKDVESRLLEFVRDCDRVATCWIGTVTSGMHLSAPEVIFSLSHVNPPLATPVANVAQNNISTSRDVGHVVEGPEQSILDQSWKIVVCSD